MATGDQRTKILDKKVLGVVEIGTRFLDVLLKASRDALQPGFPRRGLFVPCALSAGGNNAVTLGKVYGTDGTGKIALVQAGNTRITSVPFENSIGVPYDIGCTIAEAPTEVETNVRTGSPQFTDVTETLGYLGTPDGVIDNGDGTLTITVDSITEVGVDNSGRKVRVWKIVPATSSLVWAIDELVISYVAGHNVITTDKFGQTTASVVAADYAVMLMGPRITRNTPLINVAGVIFIGQVVGTGFGLPPAVFSTVDAYVYPTGESLNADVLELDAHGKWRICVRADALDSKTPMISVKNAAGTRVFWLDEAGRFHHADETAGVNGIPFGSTGVDKELDALLGSNLLGAINRSADQERVFDAALSPAVLSGCEVTAGAGLTVDVAAGVMLKNGRRWSVGAEAGVVVGGNTKGYIVTDGLSYQFTDVAPVNTVAPIAWIETDGAGLLSPPVDMRLVLSRVDQRSPIQVGSHAGAHFGTLKAAVDAVNGWGRPQSGSPARGWRIQVHGTTAEPEVITFLAGGLVIEGLPGSTGDAGAIKWGGEQALFDLNGQTDITFRDLNLVYDDAGAAADATLSRFAFIDSAGASQIRIENVTIRSVQASRLHGYMHCVLAAITDVWIDRCNWRDASDVGLRFVAATDLHVSGSKLTGAGSPQTAGVGGGRGGILLTSGPHNRIWLRDLLVSGWADYGILMSGVSRAHIHAVEIASISVAGATTIASGLLISTTSDHVMISDVGTEDVGTGGVAAEANGIYIRGEHVRVIGCHTRVDAAPATVRGIYLDGSAVLCIVDCNQTNGHTLEVDPAGGPHSIGPSNRDD